MAGNRVFVADFVRKTGTISSRPSASEEVSGHERVLCLDATTGDVLWKHTYPVQYKVSYPSSPRVSPLIQGDKVYTLGTDGDLLCLTTESGKVIWSKQFNEDYGTNWQITALPVVVRL